MLGRICSSVSACCGNAINRIPQAVRTTVRQTAVETVTVTFGAVAANISATAVFASTIGSTFGSAMGAACGTQKVWRPDTGLSKNESAALFSTATVCAVVGATCFETKGDGGFVEDNDGAKVYVFGNLFVVAQLTEHAVQIEGITPNQESDANIHLQNVRSLEWGAGACVGTLVAGAVAVPCGLGIGCGIVAGVVAMKATRAGVRVLHRKGWI